MTTLERLDYMVRTANGMAKTHADLMKQAKIELQRLRERLENKKERDCITQGIEPARN